MSGNQVEVFADLTRFEPHVFDTDPLSPTAVARVVADCDNLGLDPVTTGAFPLQYVGF